MSHLIRAELRFRKRRNVKKYTGIRTIGDFFDESCLSDLKHRFNHFVSKRIFKVDTDQIAKTRQAEISRLRFLKEEVGERQAIDEFLVQINLVERLVEIGGINSFKAILRAAGYSDSTVRRQVQDLNKRIVRMAINTQGKETMVYRDFLGKLIG